MKKTTLIVTALSLLSAAYSVNVYASANVTSPNLTSSNAAPSKDAYDVCSTLRDGESCKFKENNITVSGTCKKDQSGKGICVAEKK